MSEERGLLLFKYGQDIEQKQTADLVLSFTPWLLARCSVTTRKPETV